MAATNMLKVNLDVLSSSEDSDIIGRISIQLDSVVAGMKLHLDRKKYLQATVYECVNQGLCYEPDYTSLMMKVLRPADTVTDIGANIGYFSLLASSLVTGSGRVVALEPEKDNFRCLLRNIKLNGLSNRTALNVAAGDIKKEVDLFIDPLNDGGHSLCGITPESRELIGDGAVAIATAQMDTLDSLLAAENISNMKIIKIDTEGWEFHSIQGAISVIKRFSPPFILAEINRSGLRRAGASERYLRLLMAELGYSLHIASCLPSGKLVLELVPNNYFAEPELEHYNYNAVFVRPESLTDFSTCYYVFD
ncbi:MAG: FkbM family methyltransferase [Desulfuromonadaceae bacterium]|nr:FkbM family methyltransferase [Desulfuromonadaceae bacterium]